MESIVSWALAFIFSIAPPRAGRGELIEEAVARYEQIAADAVAVAYDSTTPPLFAGRDGRAKTAALLLSVAFHESGFRKDVDLGIGPRARGDSGQSWCLMQIKIGGGRTLEGWSGAELVRDRRLCFAAGLSAIRRSFVACRANPTSERLNAYTSGSCSRGATQSRARMESAIAWFSQRLIPVDRDDIAVMNAREVTRDRGQEVASPEIGERWPASVAPTARLEEGER